MNDFYVLGANGQPAGPHDIEALVRLVQSQQLPRDSSVAAVGQTEWAPLMSIPEIARRLETPSKRPPGPPPRRSNPPPAMTPEPTPAPAQGAVPAATMPSAGIAAASAAAPAPAPAPAEAKPAEKKDEKKPTLDPKYDKLPWLIFGAFVLVTLVLFVIAMLRSPPKEEFGARTIAIAASPA
jgi:hypothetical protein